MHIFNPPQPALDEEQVNLCKFKASLNVRVSHSYIVRSHQKRRRRKESKLKTSSALQQHTWKF